MRVAPDLLLAPKWREAAVPALLGRRRLYQPCQVKLQVVRRSEGCTRSPACTQMAGGSCTSPARQKAAVPALRYCACRSPFAILARLCLKATVPQCTLVTNTKAWMLASFNGSVMFTCILVPSISRPSEGCPLFLPVVIWCYVLAIAHRAAGFVSSRFYGMQTPAGSPQPSTTGST